ncbi:MAG: cyclic nucleotide-binding domain-containing protein [Calditrichia bacterium]|nr:cyclic nucleotide-binding domain-containing protein [Calditrichia bacterium]
MFQISEVLKKVPFFRSLGKDGISFIVERLKFKPFDTDELICKIGDPGDKMWIIISGQVKVVVKADDFDEETVIAELTGGDYFGEMALLTGSPRSASIITTEPSEMFILSKEDFDLVVERFPSITLSMGKIMSQRLRETLLKAAKRGGEKVSAAIKGSLSERQLVDILKFCESNSINGKVIVKNGDQTGKVYYQKGILQKVELGDLQDDEALDVLINWKEGEFVVEPDPLRLDEEKEPAAAAPAEPVQLIIVNASMVVQKMLQQTFEKIGYSVYAVENKQKGLNLIKKLEPDVVVADVKLPDCNGVEFVQSVREFSEIPIVLLTEERNWEDYKTQLTSFQQIGYTRSQELGEIMHAVQQISGR